MFSYNDILSQGAEILPCAEGQPKTHMSLKSHFHLQNRAKVMHSHWACSLPRGGEINYYKRASRLLIWESEKNSTTGALRVLYF